MDEDLGLDAQVAGGAGAGGDLGHGQLAGEDHPFRPEPRQLRDLRRIVHRHLGRGMALEPRQFPRQHRPPAEILDDDRVHLRLGGGTGQDQGLRIFVVVHQGVHHHIASQAVVVQVGDVARQFGGTEVLSPAPGVEVAQAQIDGIGAAGDGRRQAVGSAGRSEHLDVGCVLHGDDAGLAPVRRKPAPMAATSACHWGHASMPQPAVTQTPVPSTSRAWTKV